MKTFKREINMARWRACAIFRCAFNAIMNDDRNDAATIERMATIAAVSISVLNDPPPRPPADTSIMRKATIVVTLLRSIATQAPAAGAAARSRGLRISN